jgi:anti-sigma factor RsiW
MKKKKLMLLYRSFDTMLSIEDQHQFEETLQTSSKMKMHQQQIKEMRNKVKNSAAKSFEPGFTARVMAQIQYLEEQPATLDFQKFYDSLLWSFRRVAFGGALLSGLLFIYNFGIGNNLPLLEFLTMSDLNYHDLFSNFLF